MELINADTELKRKVDKLLDFLNQTEDNFQSSITFSVIDRSYIFLLDIEERNKKNMLITYDMTKEESICHELLIKKVTKERYLITLYTKCDSFKSELSVNRSS